MSLWGYLVLALGFVSLTACESMIEPVGLSRDPVVLVDAEVLWRDASPETIDMYEGRFDYGLFDDGVQPDGLLDSGMDEVDVLDVDAAPEAEFDAEVVPDMDEVDTAVGPDVDGGHPGSVIANPERLPIRPVPPELVEVLDDIPGFASSVIGGRDGTLYEVTHLGDGGPGSLRAGLESDGRLWIVFAEGVEGVIELEGKVRVRSYKTIDARRRSVTLRAVSDGAGDWHDTGLWLGAPDDLDSEVRDVVFLNLDFDGAWEDVDEEGRGAPAIGLHNNAHRIWVHQCSFHHWNDAAISTSHHEGRNLRPRDITISQSEFYDMDHAIELTSQRFTFALNHCYDVNTRCLRVTDGGEAHAVNNVIENWNTQNTIYVGRGSQLLVDHSIFRPSRCGVVGNAQDGNDDQHGGRWQGVHNHVPRGMRVSWNDMRSVEPEFKTAVQSAYGDDRKVDCEHEPPDYDCWADLYDAVIEDAGVVVPD